MQVGSLYPKLLGYKFQSAVFSSIAASTVGNGQVKNPVGTNKLVGMYFDPAIDIRVKGQIQSARDFFLDNFSTKIGNVGFIPLSEDLQPTDIIILEAFNAETTAQSPVLSFVFVSVND